MSSTETTPLHERIAHCRVTSERLACWWLGGSGFVFKSAAGTVLYIDPYLSDSVKSIFGVGRAFPPPIAPQDVRADAVISSHWHEDHLDPGTIPDVRGITHRRGSSCRPVQCRERLDGVFARPDYAARRWRERADRRGHYGDGSASPP